MYRNNENYPDPTAGEAIARVMGEKKKKHRKHTKRKPMVYVVSAYAGDTELNTANAAKACRYVADRGCMPVASHLMYPSMGFDDNNPAERAMCQSFGLRLLAQCDEVWCFTIDGYVSSGMRAEMNEAERRDKKIKTFELQEVVS